ncbi:rhomboid family intramembrane serine protease [Croceivirga sp. JEA036]|uniref:rhomboid family intramembrane serine protease n=1 Tax=Croceivirga sp. JEA036 TaxID=2721162 RepID=UPI0014396EF5|nr:rhomboid family intramembrane serine protease [Croceivirga sp. JEA036]NJB37646.1 rhomboid family intramembrane serine protease [Croceivirga sp. JEA036]
MKNGNLQYQFARLSVAEKLIVINIIIFIVSGLIQALFSASPNMVMGWFQLPKNFGEFIVQPWSLVTYSFFHSGIGHIFWNMLMLWFASRIFLNLFDAQRFLTVYFLGVIVGGLFFLLSYNIFPALLNTNTALIGASAGVTAVLLFVCSYIPNQDVRVFIVNVKLWHVGVFFVLIDLIQIPYGGNIGGRLAHLGGALIGYIYARQLLNGNDIGAGFSRFIEGFQNIFKPKEKKPKFKKVYKNQAASSTTTRDYDKVARQKRIDAILDKISKSGYESLSKAEKDFLFKAGKED